MSAQLHHRPSPRRKGATLALRAGAAAAAVAVAVLAPVSSTFAATPAAPSAPRTVTAVPAAADGAQRYAGTPVYIGDGMVAVLRRDPVTGGPEAWIRYVGPQWKPGDVYLVKVLGLLNRTHPAEQFNGVSVRLVDTVGKGKAPQLRVGGGTGGHRSYPVPPATAPATGGERTGTRHDAGKAAHTTGGKTVAAHTGCTATLRHDIGAGTMAILTMGPQGPKVTFADADGTPLPGVLLDRAHPTLPRFGAKIIDPYGAHPTFRYRMQGGGYPAGTLAFPSLAKDCGTTGQHGAGNSGTAGSTGKATDAAAPAKPAGGRTTVVPKGGVAAGAEGVGTPDSTPLIAAGGAVAAVGAAGIAYAVRRNRRPEGSRS
ncbi:MULTISPECIES: hypothetical protein [Streptomyces]|uniref:hypothetical protein n=1 Tax=Streptomyces TaxID=1883 RepID=UPI00069A0DFB|nr:MULTISPECIES: hypothetical protein [Streptomyces]MYU52806.1 hypothetical protein [Streptomyces sp. SID7805]